ncbi:MAG: hypothetical protein ACLRZQ_08600 [Akkermansia muciniphila]
MALSDAHKIVIHSEVISSLRKALAPLEYFKKDFRMEYASEIKFKNVKAAGNITENPSDYQTDKENEGDLIPLSLTELHQPWRITPAEKAEWVEIGGFGKNERYGVCQ